MNTAHDPQSLRCHRCRPQSATVPRLPPRLRARAGANVITMAKPEDAAAATPFLIEQTGFQIDSQPLDQPPHHSMIWKKNQCRHRHRRRQDNKQPK